LNWEPKYEKQHYTPFPRTPQRVEPKFRTFRLHSRIVSVELHRRHKHLEKLKHIKLQSWTRASGNWLWL